MSAPADERYSAFEDGLDAETLATAARDDERPTEPRRFHRCPDLVDAILASSELPWIELRLEAGGEPIVRGRAGAYVLLIGWEGSGKSSLVLQLGIVAARAGCVFIYFTTELDAEEAAARAIGIQVDESWENVQRGRVPRASMVSAASMPTFIVLAEEHATLGNLERTVDELRAENPAVVVVIAIDYLQDLDIEGRDERAKVRGASRTVRRLAKKLKAFTIAVSQTSRAGREDLRNGDAIGAETVTKGAESSQLERDAYVTLALGNPRELPDGTTAMDLSIGKGRMMKGNQVRPVAYAGRSGRWSLAGDSRSATEVRAERQSAKDQEAVTAAVDRIVGELERSAEPMTPNALVSKLRVKRDIAYRAADLLRDGAHPAIAGVVVKGQRGNNLWTKAKATAAGLALVPTPHVSPSVSDVSREHLSHVSPSPSRGDT